MITKLKFVSVPTRDQNSALSFWTEQMGFELMTDQPMGAQRWIELKIRGAETGVASHWLYKDEDGTLSEVQSRTHKWLQSLIEIQNMSGDSAEFLEHVKVDLFPEEVYVFTPKGKIMALPRGATAVDFAYAVHTDIGNRCVATKVNYELVPLRTELKSGDRVEIITAAHQWRSEDPRFGRVDSPLSRLRLPPLPWPRTPRPSLDA